MFPLNIIPSPVRDWWCKKKQTGKPRSNAEHYVDAAQVFDSNRTSESSTGVRVDVNDGLPTIVHPKTRDEGYKTDSNNMRNNSKDILISERDATIDTLTHDLEQEHQARIDAENEARQLSSRLKTTQTKWKQTANQLDQIISQSQGLEKVTDQELKDMVMQLQYNIRSFAIQYFSDPIQGRRATTRPKFFDHLPQNYNIYLKEEDNYAPVAQAFIWNVLVNHVFDRFRWAGCASRGLNELWGQLTIDKTRGSDMIPATWQKLYTWRATTSTLVSGCLTERDLSFIQQDKGKIAQRMCAVLILLSNDTYADEISDILDEAIKLDKVISSQVAMVSWDFAKVPDQKEAEGPNPSDVGDMIVVFPAMLKRGKSNGEDFHVESVLLPRVEELCVVTREEKNKT